MKLTFPRLLFLHLLFILFAQKVASQTYCTPYPSSCGGISITSVIFGTINNPSGCSINADYTTSVAAATVNAGSYMPITVSFTANTVFYGDGYVKAWIDFNQNGVFEDSESFNIATAGTNATQTFLIRIPFNAVAGKTRMRLRIETGGFDQMDACTTRTSGETEDYTVNVIPSPTPAKFFTVYVNQTANGANNGSSWANALKDLGTAFAMVKGNDTVKVAKGNYTPGYLLTSGVTYLGGYPNTGNPTDANRNFSLNATILTGQEIYGNKLQSNTTLNGFIFDNLASVYGFMAAIRLENASPLITNCVFRNGSYRIIYAYASSPVITNCFFINNEDTYVNRGLFQLINNSNPTFNNCVFTKNTSTSLINSTNSNLKLKNCTFSNNRLLPFDNGTFSTQAEIITTDNSATVVANTIFSDYWLLNFYTPSRLSDSLNLFADNSSSFSFTNSITAFSQTGINLLPVVNPRFKDSANAAGTDGLFFTADDGLQLINPCSPALNSGLNSLAEGTTDILGKPRVIGGVVDMGAYEMQINSGEVPHTLYVNASANGLKDGSSWINAFSDLQAAMANCSDTIKVAAGTYYPSLNNADGFFELQNNRIILGGYPNSGNPGNSLRNPAVYKSVLSANLPSGTKSRKLVQAALVNSSAVLDGFVLEGTQGPALDISYKAGPVIKNCTINNNAIAATIYKQSAPFITNCNFNSNATAVDINNSAPIIDSCSFKYNAAGAITNNNHANAIIKNTRFVGNSSTKGGDIYNDLSSPQIINCYSDSAFASLGGSIANFNSSNPLITSCVFKNSKTAFDNSANGGIVYNKDSKPYFLSCSFINSLGNSGAFYNLNSTVKLENCLGFANQGGYHGAAFPGVCFMTNSGSTVDLLNCNILKSSGGNAVISNMDNSLLNIKNSILWDNNFNTTAPANTYQPDIINTTSVINMSNSITRNYGTSGTNGNLVAVDPKFINISDPAGKDGLYGTADDGLTLCTCSPAIDAGVAVAQMAPTDITNSPRVINGAPDIGAYEYQSAKINRSKTLYVSASASGANDGSNWTNAYTSLQSALKNTCADTIKMMEGVYKPAINDRDSAFEINRKLYIAGGYQNIANPLEANRNPDKYPTILSGEIGNVNDTTDNSFTILKINNTDTLVKIDGLIFSNCFNDNIKGNTIQAYGGAVYSINNARLIINNCRFSHNHSTYYYGPNSLRSLYSTIELSKNIFSKNYSVEGNTLQTDNGLFNNDIFSENYSATGSDVIITGIADFKNCLFYKNFSGGQGAGVFNKGSSAFLNCDFIENTSLKNGAGLHNTGGAYLLNCIFNGNYTGNGIYADWYDYSGSPDGGSAYHQNPYTFDISYSSLQTSFPSPGFATIAGTEKFVDISNPIGPDNSWFTADDGLKLLPCSPLVDGGTITTSPILQSRNTLLPTTDITDSTRIKGVTIDLGAYEYPGYFNPVVNIKASDSVICTGSPVTFIATPRGFGDKPIFQWKVNNIATGINSDTLTTTLLKNNDSIKVFVTGDNVCSTGVNGISNTIKIKVSATLIPSITISVPAVTICQNEAATFTATAENAGTNPSYQWRVNDIIAGTNSKTFTTTGLTNNAQVKVTMNSSLSCTLPNPVTSNVIAMAIVTMPIANAGADASVCAGGSIQLSGSGGNTYSWSQVPGLSNYGISNPVATPSTNTTYVLTVSNGNNCFSKDSVNIAITQPATPSITINTASNTICEGSVTTFTASVTDGGIAPAIQWQLNGSNVGGNGNTFANNTLIDKDQVMAILTSNATCVTAPTATSNFITITTQKLDTPNVSLNDKVLLLTNPDADATYTWQYYTNGAWSNVVPFASGTSYSVINSGEYRVMAVKAPCTAYSNSNTANFRSATTNNLYGIIVYPNPASKTIVLDSLKLSQHWASIDIVSAEGRPVLSKFNITNQNTVSINISGLINGIYFIKVKSLDDIVTVIKFIKF